MLARLLADVMAGPWRALRDRRAAALYESGRRSADRGDDEGARRRFEKALSLQAHPGLWAALGDVRHRQGDLGKAEVCYRAALESEPNAAVYLRLGRTLIDMGSMDEAIGALRRAYELDSSAAIRRELVLGLIQADNVRKAAQLAEAAASADPADPEAQRLLGIVRQKAHDPVAAIACFDAALKRLPADPELHDFRGLAHQDLGRPEEAMADYERALALQPGHASAAFHRGMVQLLLGDFAHGWDGYQLRRLNAPPTRGPAYPIWDGASLEGRTLLVRREQGLGDEIMFASLLPELIREARACLVECDPRLRSLFARSFPEATFFASLPDGSVPGPIAARSIDVETQAGSIAGFRRRSAEAFPRHAGYLHADPNRIERCRERLDQLGSGAKVGISWSGGVRRTRRGLRSLPLVQWAPILSVPGVRFVSLQYTREAEQEIKALRREQGIAIEHWPEVIEDYEETAALVCTLDLVVSVCTSVIHLGGALGRPVWVLAPRSPEWRYGAQGESMVWYPSVRIFRQPSFGNWAPVVDEAASALRERLAG